MCDVLIRGKAGEVLPDIVEVIEKIGSAGQPAKITAGKPATKTAGKST
jgi:hypothetical protein